MKSSLSLVFGTTLLACSGGTPTNPNHADTAAVTVSTLAGNGTTTLSDGTGGPSGTASFGGVTGVVADSQGNVYVADPGGERIRKIDSSGNVTTLAGSTPGYADGQGAAAQFNAVGQITIDGANNLYVTDGPYIREIDPSGNVSTYLDGTDGGLYGADTNGSFTAYLPPEGVVADSAGDLYISTGTSQVLAVDTSRNITIWAGNGTIGSTDGTGGPNGTATFLSPGDLALDQAGNLYVSDGNAIRKVDTNGNVSTVAGGFSDFSLSLGVAVDGAGNVFFSNQAYEIEQIDTAGNVTVLAGSAGQGFADGPGNVAQFLGLQGIAMLGANLVAADQGAGRVRLLSF